MERAPVRVVIADQHPSVRDRIRQAMSGKGDIDVVGEFGRASQVLETVDELHPNVVLTAVSLPDMPGPELAARLREEHRGVHTIVLAARYDEEDMVAAFVGGARGYTANTSPPPVLRYAVRAVAAGGCFADPAVTSRLIGMAIKGQRGRGPFGLTPREMEVLRQLPKGRSNKEIGRQLGIAEPTVKSHVSSILGKLDANDRSEAGDIARRRGLA